MPYCCDHANIGKRRLAIPLDNKSHRVHSLPMRKGEPIEGVEQAKLKERIRLALESKAREFEATAMSYQGATLYYAGDIVPVDGNPNNRASENLAMVCPRCGAHILLSRFASKDIWLLKATGLSNADIGRLLGLSRERVRQVCRKHETGQKIELEKFTETDINELVRKARYLEDILIDSGKLRRRIDRRTKKKRIIAELNRLRANKAQNPPT